MCVITFKKPGVALTKDLVKELWTANKDGAGYLYRVPDKGWFFKKGIMELEELLSCEKIFDINNEVVLHLRIKTKGDISEAHTHPFDWSPANSKNNRYLFHNGTVKILNPPNGDSDSSFLAKILSNVETEEGFNMLTKFSKDGMGRFVALANNEIKLFGDNESTWDGGLWFSNDRHIKKTTVWSSRGYMASDVSGHSEHTEKKKKSYPAASVESPERLPFITDLARFYSKEDKVAYSDEYREQWSERNAISLMCTAILEAAVNRAKAGGCDDPLFDVILAFKDK